MHPSVFSSLLLAAAGVVCALALGILVTGIWRLAELKSAAAAAHGVAMASAQQAVDVQTNAALSARTGLARAELQKLAIAPGGVVPFISAIEARAADAGISATIGSLLATPPSGAAPGSLTLKVNAEGSYGACMKFLQLIETQSALEISNVSLSRSTDRGWQLTLTLTALSYDVP